MAQTMSYERKSKDNWLTRLPYGSAIAAIMCIVGSITFIAQFYTAIGYTIRVLNDVFDIDFEIVYWMGHVRVICILVGCTMGIYSLVLLAAGFSATGATRQQIFGTHWSILSGRVTLAVCFVLAYVMEMIWLFVFGISAMCVFCFFVLHGMCGYGLIPYGSLERELDFRQFRFMLPTLPSDFEAKNRLVIKGSDYHLFCKSVYETESLYIGAMVAAFVVVIGLIHFMVCTVSNYVRISDHVKKQELLYLRTASYHQHKHEHQERSAVELVPLCPAHLCENGSR